MANWLSKLIGKRASFEQEATALQAAAVLPPQPPPKPPKGGGAAYPGHRKQTVATAAAIPKPSFDVTNVDLTATYRFGTTTQEVVRNLARVNPELAASIAVNNRVGIPEKYIAIARNPDGSFNREATQLVLQMLRQMYTMPDYINGFSHVGSLRSVCESLAKEIQMYGAACLELVLDKARLPYKLQPITIPSILFYDEDKGTKPMQKVGGEEIDLDLPTVFYVALDASLNDVYAQSPVESAIQPILASTTFLSDLRKLCGRHIYPRLDISIDEEKLRARIPEAILADNDLLNAFLNETIASVETAINEVGVEEALVHFDFFEVKYIEGGTGDVPETMGTVRDVYDGKIATALKTPPSALGMGSRTAGIGDVETLMFMVNTNGMIRIKLQELLSKAFTLAARLFGLDVTVEFEFDDIELRPAGELESYRTMKFERLTNQLSYGFITDDECCLRLTGQLTPVGYTAKTDTMFKIGSSQPPGNPDSQTSTMPKKTPEKAKGGQKK